MKSILPSVVLCIENIKGMESAIIIIMYDTGSMLAVNPPHPGVMGT